MMVRSFYKRIKRRLELLLKEPKPSVLMAEKSSRSEKKIVRERCSTPSASGIREVLFRALTSAEEIDAAFVSFEDGYHRAVTRIDADRRRSDPKSRSAPARWLPTDVRSSLEIGQGDRPTTCGPIKDAKEEGTIMDFLVGPSARLIRLKAAAALAI